MKKILPLIASSLVALSASALTISEKTTFTGTEVLNEKLTINSVLYTIGDGTAKSSLTVSQSSSPIANNGRILVSAGSELIVQTTSKQSWSTVSPSGKMDIYGTVIFDHIGGGDPFVCTVSTGKTFNLFSGGTLKVQGVGSGGIDVNGGTMNLKTGSTVDISSGLFFLRNSSGSTTLNVQEGVTFKNGFKVTLGTGSISTLNLSEANNITISRFALKNDCKFTLVLPKTSLVFKEFTIENANSFTGIEEIILKEFQNDIIKINNAANLTIIDDEYLSVVGKKIKLTAYDTNDNLITLSEGDHWEFSNGYLNLVMTSVVVPEPAEWAVIFGGIALGLAIYRRRK